MPGSLEKLRPIDSFPIAYHNAMEELMLGASLAVVVSWSYRESRSVNVRSQTRRFRAFINSAGDPRFSKTIYVEWLKKWEVLSQRKEGLGMIWIEARRIARPVPDANLAALSIAITQGIERNS